MADNSRWVRLADVFEVLNELSDRFEVLADIEVAAYAADALSALPDMAKDIVWSDRLAVQQTYPNGEWGPISRARAPLKHSTDSGYADDFETIEAAQAWIDAQTPQPGIRYRVVRLGEIVKPVTRS